MKILEKLKNSPNLEDFINNSFQEIYDFFHNQTQTELYLYKKEIKQYLRQSKREITLLDCSKKTNGDFIALLIDSCEKLHLFMEFGLFYDYLSKCGYRLGDRLQSSHQYCNGIKKFDDYYDKNSLILELLKNAYLNEEDTKEQLTATYINFYLHSLYNFGGNKQSGVIDLRKYFFSQIENIVFLDKKFINIIFNININDYKKAYSDSLQILNDYLYQNVSIHYCIEYSVKIEESIYSKKLRNIHSLNFNNIFNLSKDYVEKNIKENEKNLHYSLNRGMKILEEQNELFQYIKSFGKMHKAKLYASFDTFIHKLNNKTINVIDWGCGQALATALLIDYIKENNFHINISNLTLIEPSSLALSRGMLHIDVLKENEIDITTVNKDIDSLEVNDLTINYENNTLHLFSNILDVEFFKLNKEFLTKVSTSQNGINYFLCVSPNINDKRNSRLNIFYKYFKDNFDTKLISNRDSDIGKYTRYEKIFRVNINKKDLKG